MSETKSNFFTSWHKDLEKELEQLKKEKQEERKKYEIEMKEIIKKELAEIERKNNEKISHLESKFRKLYYWLFGIVCVFLVIISGMFFYLRSSK